MQRVPVWLQTIIVALVVIPIVAVLTIWILQSDSSQEYGNTTESTTVETTTTTTLPEAEVIDGVSVVFQTRSNAFRNDDIRDAISTAVSILPKYLADEIRGITVYVVDDAILCADSSPPPGMVIAGCADGNGGNWIELIANNGGYKLYVVVHEFGHIIGGHQAQWGTQRYATYFNQIYVAGSGDSPPTKYGNKYFAEDYAESFSLYVLDQDRLRLCCSDRYSYFEELFKGSKPIESAKPNPAP